MGMKVYDTTSERACTLSDGARLVYRRPGGNLLRTVAQDALVDALTDRTDRLAGMDPEERLKFEGRMERRAAQKDDAREAELAGLSGQARRDRERDIKFRSLEHHRLIAKCAVSWTLQGEPVVSDLTDLEELRDLPDEVLADAARAIYDSHYDREKDLQGNSQSTSAS